MNYYNPYFYTMPTAMTSAPKVGLLSRLFGRSGLTFSSILSGTQKVLGVANQAIPLVKQVQPMMNNAKTMFKIMNEFKRSDSKPKSNNKATTKNNSVYNSNQPTKNIKTNNTSENNTSEKIESDNNHHYEDYDNGPTFFI